MQKIKLSLIVVAILVLALAAPALADGTITIAGGTLAVAPQAISFPAVTLDGTAKNDLAGTTTQWTATDPTGTGAGWHVTITATDFTNEDLKTIPVSGFDMRLTTVTKLDATSGAEPTINPSFAAFSPLSASAQNVLSAAIDSGMGSYGFTPEFQLDVPANAYAGTYTSTVTVQILSAP